MNLRDFGERLTEERNRLGYTQAGFARLLGVSRIGLRNIEAGESDFKAQFMATAAASGVDIQYVLTGVRSQNTETVAKEIGFEKQVIKGNVSGIGFVGAGSQVQIVNTQQHITRTKVEAKPGLEHIQDSQKRILTDLVDQIVETESLLKKMPKTHRSVWSSLNKHCGVTSYHLIKLEDFDKARKFLNMWLGRLNSSASAPVKNGDAWRNKKIAYIKTNTKNPEDEAAMRAYIKREFKAVSLKELANDELERTYGYVAGLKRRKR
ncbi:helix-turn-helix domain-containing protein [Ochrobactrum sp. BTU2]|uniref:helix-turn-helix domain-containing protein n=1 Tax=Ochrobactrum sp. BTU2 TaxID=2856166 RepID=UPI00211A0D7D|nr:helix-turn-helix domain-containing protein [Ochrobactrum sp. BTU2]MCQ9145882.1 ORF6C domain-containing protein [Ochrobactrum sp. BTU2]